MGDTVDSVIGCGNILKNSVGTIGIIIILGIVLLPIIKLIVLLVSFKLASALCEVVADTKIVKLIDQIADSYKILLDDKIQYIENPLTEEQIVSSVIDLSPQKINLYFKESSSAIDLLERIFEERITINNTSSKISYVSPEKIYKS